MGTCWPSIIAAFNGAHGRNKTPGRGVGSRVRAGRREAPAEEKQIMQRTALRQVEHRAPEASFQDLLAGLSTRYQARWWRTPTDLPDLGPELPRRRQRRNQRRIDRFADRLEAEVLACPAGEAERRAWRDRLRDMLRDFGDDVVALPEAERRVIFSDDYFEATARFAREARAFDPGLEIHDLSQALRNVWIMHLVQLLFDRRPAVTLPIFAYSLLYPYTDNPLDDPALAASAKAEFCARLERRLEGERLLPRDPRERSVFRLIGLIEESWPRREVPRVYASLLAIHRAQTRSLAQPKVALCEPEILRISVEKGGASVLADGYLVAGELSPEEADFFFGYGVFLQLADDLQDLEQDLAVGHATLFSRAAHRKPLDPLVNRLVHFLDGVLASERFSAGRFDVLKSLIRHSCVQLVVQSVGLHPGLFTRRYRRILERRSLTRFAYLRKQRGTLFGRYRRLNQRLSRATSLGSIFEAMG